MKVLEQGKPNQTWNAEVLCDGSGNGEMGCGSRLELEYDDLVYWPGVPGDSWGSRDPAVSWRCVVCGEVNDLPKFNWPNKPSHLPNVTGGWYKKGYDDHATESEK